MIDQNKDKPNVSLNEAIGALNKKFGKNYLSKGNDNYYDESRISTGIFSLDTAMGGGIPNRKVVTIAGEYSSGKTTVALLTAREYQKQKKKVVYIDTDNGLDLSWAKKLGVNVEDMHICQPDYIEQVSDTIETLLMTNEVGLIIFDSVANTPHKKELDDSCEQESMGGIGKAMARMMRKITKRLNHTDCSVLIINQLRDNIGVMWGNTEVLPGGRALKFQSDIIVFLKPSNWIPENSEPRIGKTSKFRITKNRTAPPLQVGSFDIYFDGRVDNNTAVITEALKAGIVFRAGGWFHYKDDKNKIQGLSNFIDHLVETNELEEIQKKLLETKDE
jgi:recombination protein RecA